MVLIFTGNEQLDRALCKVIKDSRIVFYPNYILEEKEAKTLIVALQPDKFNFKEFMFEVRKKDIQVILILENDMKKELKEALMLGIYDIVLDPFDLKDVYSRISKPNSFSKVSKYIQQLLELDNY